MGLFERPLGLEERLRLESAIVDAFAPLRERRAAISPARVRARVLWEQRDDGAPALRGIALVSRLTDVTLAFAVTALFFVGTLAGVTGATESTSDMLPQPEATVSAALSDEDLRLAREARIAALRQTESVSIPVLRDGRPIMSP